MFLHNLWLIVTSYVKVSWQSNCHYNEFCHCIECRYKEGCLYTNNLHARALLVHPWFMRNWYIFRRGNSNKIAFASLLKRAKSFLLEYIPLQKGFGVQQTSKSRQLSPLYQMHPLLLNLYFSDLLQSSIWLPIYIVFVNYFELCYALSTNIFVLLLTLTTLWADSADDKLMMFFWGDHLHVCFIAYFLAKIRKIFQNVVCWNFSPEHKELSWMHQLTIYLFIFSCSSLRLFSQSLISFSTFLSNANRSYNNKITHDKKQIQH